MSTTPVVTTAYYMGSFYLGRHFVKNRCVYQVLTANLSGANLRHERRDTMIPQPNPQSSFCKSLFHGEILENLLFPYPELKADEAETIKMIFDSLDKLRGGVDSAKIDEDGKLPAGLLEKLGGIGLMGLCVPHEYGGLGLSNSAYARVMENVAQLDPSVAVTLGAHQSIGFKALTLFGSEEQKKKYGSPMAHSRTSSPFSLKPTSLAVRMERRKRKSPLFSWNCRPRG